ncbi:OB-fold domain-containing protein [Leptospira borgpetersenii]|uniref:OB-fold domain-containing protein n=1 Tax=Leptospira borgpetersenii TaxID=174 RepID=UPI00188DBD52|nr:OB-fold domain-containing protein [Leptospira borgpetersenii]MBF3375829.1 OB-fold domain-containing protein [Leptospira borgpetersenii serovar Balcanica]
MYDPVLLGISDSIASDFSEDYKGWSGERRVLEHYKKSIYDLLQFLEMKPETLKDILTDFVSIEPASLGKSGYGHSVGIANELGYAGFRSHLVDLGGASVTGALGQAKSILGIPKRDAMEHLKNGELRLKGGKKIKVNKMGGILNYQAAMSISAATGLIDVAAHYGLYSRPVSNIRITRPGKSLVGGNGGVDSINTVAIFSSTRSTFKSKKIKPKHLFLNQNEVKNNEIGTVYSSTTVNMNPGFFTKVPYSLALVKMKAGGYIMVNIFDFQGKLLKTDHMLRFDSSKLKVISENGFLKGILI